MSDASGFDRTNEPLRELVTTIVKEKATAHYGSIRALWCIGDQLLKVKQIATPGSWRKIVAQCATTAGVHPGSLDDAARTATAFPSDARECLLTCFADAVTQLTRSHVIALSRMTPARRRRAIEAMLHSPCSVANLRSL